MPNSGPQGSNSSLTLVPMREQENAYKGVFFFETSAYTRVHAKRGVKWA